MLPEACCWLRIIRSLRSSGCHLILIGGSTSLSAGSLYTQGRRHKPTFAWAAESVQRRCQKKSLRHNIHVGEYLNTAGCPVLAQIARSV